MSLMSERTDAAGESEKFIYDAQGNLSEHQDRNGTRTQYRYNMYGALTLRENRESGLQEVYGYGKDGRLSYAIGGGMRYDYTYHADGSVKECF